MSRVRGVSILALLLILAACAQGKSTTTAPNGVTTSMSAPISTTVALSTTTMSSPGVSTFEWQRIPLDAEADHQQWMTGVAVLEGRVVAVGVDWTSGDGDAAVWLSDDGSSWSRVRHDETVFGGDGWQSMYGVAAFDGGLVAVGDDWDSTGRHDGAVWISPDGLSWTRIRDDSFGGSRGQIIYDVVGYEGRLVAVGIDFSDYEGIEAPTEGERGDAAVWVSDDGYTWRRAAREQLGLAAAQVMRGVAGGESHLAAVGMAHRVRNVDPAVWISADGETWSPVAEETLGRPEIQSMNGVASIGSGFVAVGSSGADAAVWMSLDGTSWTGVSHDPGVFGGTLQAELRLTSVIALDGGVVAIGHVRYVGGPEDAIVLLSDDGQTWTRIHDETILGGPGQQMMEAIVNFGGSLIAVGRDGTGTSVNPGVWIALPPDG